MEKWKRVRSHGVGDDLVEEHAGVRRLRREEARGGAKAHGVVLRAHALRRRRDEGAGEEREGGQRQEGEGMAERAMATAASRATGENTQLEQMA